MNIILQNTGDCVHSRFKKREKKKERNKIDKRKSSILHLTVETFVCFSANGYPIETMHRCSERANNTSILCCYKQAA